LQAEAYEKSPRTERPIARPTQLDLPGGKEPRWAFVSC
jgi:hypothetical protein